ncbi:MULTISPECIES: ABC transporter ATP-binding protein [Flavobacteriaceae]|uniref:ABC transporter ATP-binding protein n=2 Tax=Flavobacteriaceae TaxID=49546 RepID=A0A4Y8AYH4_9FLAO|nr:MULTISPECIES: ABC transporter ATP-binding protein [Flavobacteriaceae]TEW76942.1 ABC transporter ATP-binding protein [Gramella jeungdoensis]GGK59149.1 ABC transporter [Lutibacter litoralis]
MKALKYLNKYFLKYKYRLLIGLFITFCSKYLALQIPQLISKSLDASQDYKNGLVTDLTVVKADLLNNILLIVGAALLSGFFTFIMRQTIIVTSRLIEFDLKNEIYQQYQRLSLNFYKKNKTGDLMNRISEDVSKVRMYFGPAIMYSMNMLVLFIVAIVKMYNIDVTLTNYTLLPLPVLSVSIYVLSRIINKRSTVVQQYLSKLTANAQETFSGISILKSYGIERNAMAEFGSLSVTAKEKNINLFKAQALFFPLMILLIGLSNILVIYIGGLRYIAGEITIGVIAEFIMYVNMLTWPVAVVGWVTSIVQQAEASQERINEFLKHKPEIKNLVATPSQIKGDIEFKDVTFTYDDTNITALKNLSFTLKQGETLAILGNTGSGKSTILNLIARLYDTDSGEVLIDGKNIKDLNLDDIRQNIGFVPQEAFLFSDTIKNNIKFGDNNASDEKIEQAAKNAYIHHNIIDFNEGYNTYVGERGVTLSGGQKQRISIARALIKDPKILILDDCLSAVDTETEETILNNLHTVSHNKTTLIVSHRVSSVKNADKIIVIENGTIVQQGTHNQLVNKIGYYKELYEQQLLEKEL